MSYSIRVADGRDLETLLTLCGEFYAESNYAFDERRARRALEELLTTVRFGRVWVAESDDAKAAPIGYAVLALGFSIEHGGRDAFVDELYVKPEHRRSGIARSLLRELESGAVGLRVNVLHLEVEAGNDPAASLYKDLGFEGGSRRLLSKQKLQR